MPPLIGVDIDVLVIKGEMVEAYTEDISATGSLDASLVSYKGDVLDDTNVAGVTMYEGTVT